MAINEDLAFEEQNDGAGRRNGRNNVLFIILLLLLISSVGANIYQYNNQSKKEKAFNEELFSSTELQKQLNNQIDSAKKQLEEYKGRNAKLDAEIDKAEKDLVSKGEQVSKLLKSNKINYNKYLEVKDKLDEMSFLKDKYMKKVAELSEQNKQLTTQNENLKQEVKEGKHAIDKLTDKVVSNQNKVDLASRLTANNINITGVYFKKNNKEVETSKAKHIQKLKFCFTMAENKIANSGKRDVFIQVIDPRGQSVAIESLGSGTTTIDGTQAQYTTKEQVEFDNDPKDYCLYWGKDSPFEPGQYLIVLSTEGYKLGEKEFKIK